LTTALHRAQGDGYGFATFGGGDGFGGKGSGGGAGGVGVGRGGDGFSGIIWFSVMLSEVETSLKIPSCSHITEDNQRFLPAFA
jgi:hypothetical protein